MGSKKMQRLIDKATAEQEELKKRLAAVRGQLTVAEKKLEKAKDRAMRWKDEAKAQQLAADRSSARVEKLQRKLDEATAALKSVQSAAGKGTAKATAGAEKFVGKAGSEAEKAFGRVASEAGRATGEAEKALGRVASEAEKVTARASEAAGKVTGSKSAKSAKSAKSSGSRAAKSSGSGAAKSTPTAAKPTGGESSSSAPKSSPSAAQSSQPKVTSAPDESWTVVQLRAEARARGISGMSNKPKAQLLAALR